MEAVIIESVPGGELLNEKTEWNSVRIPRARVDFEQPCIGRDKIFITVVACCLIFLGIPQDGYLHCVSKTINSYSASFLPPLG